jgi:O-antigen ligase
MIVLKRTYETFFFLGVLFLPFNSQIPEWLGFLGEYSRESTPLFFLIGTLFLFIEIIAKGKLYLPLKSSEYYVFTVFVLILILSVFFNIINIKGYYFKETTGLQRFIRQFISLIMISILFFTLFFNVCRNLGVINFFQKLRRVFFISFVIVFSCGILEFLIITFNINELVPLIEIYNFIPFVEIGLDYRLERVSSTTFEPPALSTYLLTISGFMFSYIFTSKKAFRFLPFLLVIVLALLTKSRTAFVVIIVQVVIGVYYAYKKYPKFRTLFTKAFALTLVFIIFGLTFKGKDIYDSVNERIDALNFTKNLEFKSSENAVSNKSRLGIQYANFMVFRDHPIFGVGWGQQTYEARKYYPDWALKHNYEFKTMYLNEDVKSFPPGYNMYLRILTETGIFGLSVFLFFLYIIIKKVLLYYKCMANYNYINIALMISFFGYVLNWLQIDSFRLYGFWICLTIIIMLKKLKDEENYSIDSTL